MRMEINRKPTPLSIVLLIVGLLLITAAIWIGYGINQTIQAVNAFKTGELTAAAESAERALPIAHTVNRLTLGRVPDVRVWTSGLEILQQTPTMISTWQSSLDISQTNPISDSTTDTTSLTAYFTTLQTVADQLPKTWLIQRIYPEQVRTANQMLSDISVLYQTTLTGKHTFLILFQNTHELRASGGFIGSYALVTLNNGRLGQIDVQDIYVPDGQYTGYVTAPAGVQEYLSSGRGLRLPDANWWPDFPASAQQVLAYFALGQESGLDGVIAINLEVAESLLTITGDVFIPDYQMTITAENVADALRSQRDEFFPGSITKQHLLASFFNQMKFKLANLPPSQQQKIFEIIPPLISQKHIQAYANDDQLQALLIKHEAAGLMTNEPEATDYVYLVESNVGINKANRGVSREVQLDIAESTSSLKLTLTNANPATTAATAQVERPDLSPHYVNYQRLYLPAEADVTSLSINQTQISQWHEDTITTYTGEHFKQVGFLVTVPAQTSSLVTIEWHHPQLSTPPTMMLQKQAGLPIAHYRLTYQGETRDTWLNQDTWLSF